MFSIQHPIRRMIYSQYQFLKSMIDTFPQLLNEWVETQRQEVDSLSKVCAQGDYDVYRTIYNSEISRIDNCVDEELLFNQAMLIMVYSFYESFLNRISKEINLDVSNAMPSKIACKNEVVLDDYYKDISSFLFHVIRPIRNQLCHNNSGTLFSREDKETDIVKIKDLHRHNHIQIEDGVIYIVDKSFIHDILDQEFKLLVKLSDICGFKTIKK